MPASDDFAKSAVIITGDPRAKSQVISSCADPSFHVPLDEMFHVQSDQFKGVCMVHLKGLGSSSATAEGTRWLGKSVLQGKFTKCTPAADLWVGQELWNKPKMPASLQKLVFTTAAKMFSSTCRVQAGGTGPVGFLNPALAMAQIVNISRPGLQPDIGSAIQEDMRLLSSKLTNKQGQPLTSLQRQKFFDKPENLSGLVLDTTNIYTFVICQGVMDLLEYKLSLGGLVNVNLDMAHLLNGQPVSILCKNIRVISGCLNPSVHVPLDERFHVQSDQFEGVCMVHLKGLGSSAAKFKGTRWLGKTVLQGKFTKCTPAADLWVGQELWNKPKLPASLQKLVFTTAAKMFSSTCRVQAGGTGPVGFLNPALAMAQIVNISRPGLQPDIGSAIQEDMRLLSSKLTNKQGQPLTSLQRQKFFDKPENLSGLVLDTTNIYTFVICQGVMDLLEYKLSLGGLINVNLDMAHLLNGQPVSILCKNIRGAQQQME
eukprot:gene12576-12706_t